MTPDDPRHQHPDDPGQGTPASRDDLASALLDGLLTGDEAAAARRRPDVVARAAEMDAARSAVRAVPSPDPAARDRAVAAALAAFDDEAIPAGAGGPPAATASPSGEQGVAADLDARRRAHARARGRGAPRWLGAAAAVAAALVGVAGLVAVSSDGGSDDEASQSSASSDERTSSGGAGDDAGQSAGDSAEAPLADAEAGSGADTDAGRSASYEAGDLGAFPSEQALLDRVDSLLAADGDGAQVAPNATSPPPADVEALAALCPDGTPPPLDDPASAVRLHGRALVDGRDVEVWVVDTVDGRRVLALDTACAVVVDRPLG